MRKEDKGNRLADALDTLDAADIAPDWRQNAGWARIAQNLERRQKRAIPVWSYTAAAALAFLIGVIILQRQGTGNKSRDLAKAVLPAPNAQPASGAQSLTIAKQKAVIKIDVAAANPVEIHIPKVQTISRDTSLVTAAIPQDTQKIVQVQMLHRAAETVMRRQPAIVYTLTEIMDGEPERVLPPARKYSGIFHPKSSSSADVPDGQLLQRRRLRRDDDLSGMLSSSPDIIN